jgi:carbonic anhydrase
MKTAALVALGWIAAATQPTHWGYEGKEGPQHWGQLSARFAECSEGHRQSPIDIRNATPSELRPLEVHYKPVPLRALNNGHTVVMDVPRGSRLTAHGHPYRLVQLHFHSPSEEAVDGQRHALVAHLIHEDSAGRKVVVAVLFDVGNENAALAPLFDALPQSPGAEVTLPRELIHLDEIMPSRTGYFEYEGSLTTPPCTEGVRWFVLKQPVTLSARQLAKFRELYPNNARPLQPLGGRLVRQTTF